LLAKEDKGAGISSEKDGASTDCNEVLLAPPSVEGLFVSVRHLKWNPTPAFQDPYRPEQMKVSNI
jgi:hypothetical protein